MYMSEGECRWVSSLKSCLRHIVELITGTSSDSFSTRASTSPCWVPRTGQEGEGHGHHCFLVKFSALLPVFYIYIYIKQNSRMLFSCVFAHVTCSSQEGTEANTCALVFKLHHIYPTGGNKLHQLFTELHPGKKCNECLNCVVRQNECLERLQQSKTQI